MRNTLLLCVILSMLIPVRSSFAGWEGISPIKRLHWSIEKTVREIIHEAQKQEVDPVLALAIAEVESKFQPRAVRYEPHLTTASVGLFQVLHTTARDIFGFKGTIEDLKDPRVNIRLGVSYLSKCPNLENLSSVACCYQAGFNANQEWCSTNPTIQEYLAKLNDKYQKWSEMIDEN